MHHSDRGSQYASEDYRAVLQKHGLTGSMGRRGNPYDNAKAESFMKTLKVEAVYLMAYETFEDVTADLPGPHPGQGCRWPEPALGGGYHLHRNCDGLRLSGGSP